MDSSILDTGSQFDASKLSDTDKKELNQFIQAETQKAKIQESKFCRITSKSPSCNTHMHSLASFLSSSNLVSEATVLLLLQICHLLRFVDSSRPQPNRHLLEEMHHRKDFGWEAFRK